MSDVIERIRFFVPVISICFSLAIILTDLYIKLRKRIPVRVNCWFCNVNTNVQYSQRSSWTCTSCEQYNGFDKNGDYNCDIPAQRSIYLNKTYMTEKNPTYVSTTPKRNGLCETCNRNQEIKIQKLASFEPNVKGSFKTEIENFREKLDKSYELCLNCQRVVKKTLNRIANNILGLRLAQIEAKGLQSLDCHVQIADSKKCKISNRIFLATIVGLSTLNLSNVIRAGNLSKNHLDSHLSPIVTHFILLGVSYFCAVKLLIMEYLTAIPFFHIDFAWARSNITDDMIDAFKLITATAYFNEIDLVINAMAVLLSLKIVLQNDVNRRTSILIMMFWNVNMLWPTISSNMMNQFSLVKSSVDLLQFFIAMLLLALSIVKCILSKGPSPKEEPVNSSFHRIYSSCDADLSENSDSEITSCSDFYNLRSRSKMTNSFNAAKCFAPNVLKSVPLGFSTNDLNTPSFRSGHRNPNFSSQKYGTDAYVFSPNGGIENTKRCSSMLEFSSSFRVSDDCQNRLSDLHISGRSRKLNTSITCATPTASLISSIRRRSELLTPAQLNLSGNSHLTTPATKTSWVAGGFFVKNNVSPKKSLQAQNGHLHPILSRTSSQSSGFESRASSAHNENISGSLRSSRESSVFGDVFSNFSEPIQISNSRSDNHHYHHHQSPSPPSSELTTIFAKTLARPQSFVSLDAENRSIDTPCTFVNNHPCANLYNSAIMPQPVYHRFGTHRQNTYEGTVLNLFSYNNSSDHSEVL